MISTANPLRNAKTLNSLAWDPRLSLAGNRIARRLTDVLEGLGRMESWLRSQGRAGLTPADRLVLAPAFSRLAGDASRVAALAQDLTAELNPHERAKAQ